MVETVSAKNASPVMRRPRSERTCLLASQRLWTSVAIRNEASRLIKLMLRKSPVHSNASENSSQNLPSRAASGRSPAPSQCWPMMPCGKGGVFLLGERWAWQFPSSGRCQWSASARFLLTTGPLTTILTWHREHVFKISSNELHRGFLGVGQAGSFQAAIDGLSTGAARRLDVVRG